MRERRIPTGAVNEEVAVAMVRAAVESGQVEVVKATLGCAPEHLDMLVRETEASVREQGIEPSCRAGCNACCRGLVPVNRTEADRVLGAVDALPIPVQAVARRRALARSLLADDDPDLLTLPCPLLDSVWRTCLIYGARPVACRGHVSYAPAIECEVGRDGPTQDPAMVGLLTAISYVHGPPLVLSDLLAEHRPPAFVRYETREFSIFRSRETLHGMLFDMISSIETVEHVDHCWFVVHHLEKMGSMSDADIETAKMRIQHASWDIDRGQRGAAGAR